MRTLLVLTEINQKFGALGSQHGLASIAAVLKQNGYADITLSHFPDTLDLDKWRRELADFKPDLVGFYTTAEQFHYIEKLIEQTPPNIFTICGGPHVTCFPVCLENVPRLDAVCVGEGEYPMLELLRALEEGKDYTQIENLWVRHNGKVYKNPTRPFIQGLDSLPYEDRQLFNTQEYIDKYGLAQIRVLASRGCPYSCTYCSNKKISQTQTGRYVRHRSAAHVLGELNDLKRHYRFEEVFFDDDIFTLNRRVVDEFCERYPSEIGKPFVFAGRVEACRKEVLEKLQKAGGRRIDFGVESGNEDLRSNIMKRKMSNRQIIEATNLAKSVGLQVKTLNMVGLPDETKDKFQDTIEINRQINPDVASLSVFCPYPGTALYYYCLEKHYLAGEYALDEDYVSRRESLLELPGFSKKEIMHCFHWFGFHVFCKHSLVKAMGYKLIYSTHGEFFLELSKKFRKVIRKFLKGF